MTKPIAKKTKTAKAAKPAKAQKLIKAPKPAEKQTTLADLAKELKLPSRELIAQLSESGIGIGSLKDVLNDVTIKKIKRALLKNAPKPKEAQEPVQLKPAKEPEEKKAKPSKAATVAKPAPAEPVAAEEKKPAQEKEPSLIKPEIPAVAQKTIQPEKVPAEKILRIKLPISVKDLAFKMSMAPSLLIKHLMDIRVMATINQMVDENIAKQVTERLGYKLEPIPTVEEEAIATHEEQDLSKLRPRAPVVTFMGHVDHGKTSLLDYIRKSKVADSEKGGITQHIGAYRVKLARGEITFLDTPGHEAFTAMRARGAKATDIVVLVIAADDGIKPQTIEAIDHARAAGVSIIIAMNKIDKPNINIDKLKKQLAEIDLAPEDWGGKTITVGVSAKTGQGVDTLLEMIVLEAEMLELKADPKRPARGVVIEGKLSKGGGPIATVLVENGTLYPGSIVVCGQYYGKLRALIDDRIHKVKQATPSMPVEILGLNGVPAAGDQFFVVDSDKKAKEITEIRAQKIKDETLAPMARKISLEDLYAEIKKGSVKELKIILKADVQGSVEALTGSLLKIDTKEIRLNIIHKSVGEVNESDVLLAAASNAVIIGLHTAKTAEADEAAKKEGVDIKLYSIIYEAISDIKAALEGMLEPKLKEEFKGRAVVRQVFKVSKAGTIAGCYVQKGVIKRTANCKVVRNGQEVFNGKLSSLKRFKDDVKEVAENFECGIAVGGFDSVQVGDIIEAFEVIKIARKL